MKIQWRILPLTSIAIGLNTILSQPIHSEPPLARSGRPPVSLDSVAEPGEMQPEGNLTIEDVKTVGNFRSSYGSQPQRPTHVQSRRRRKRQITSVSQLSDVQPTDWAFQALQSLVERYGCIAGYPNGTYQGNRALTRYEFAAGLNACLERMTELISTSTESLVSRGDLLALQRLQEEFAAELASLAGRVNVLEARTAELEANQFSTTTKLSGVVIFNSMNSNNPEFNGNRKDLRRTDSDLDQAVLGGRFTFDFDTSFTGTDRLRVELRGGRITRQLGDQTNMGGLDYEFDSRKIVPTSVEYRRNFDDRSFFWVSAFGVGLDAVFLDNFNPYFQRNGAAFTQFAVRNPIYRQPSGTQLAAGHRFNDWFGMAVAYTQQGPTAANARPGDGLFNGSYSTGANLRFTPTENWRFGLTYIFSYYKKDDSFLLGNTGSERTFDPFFGNPTTAHNVGFQTTALLTPHFNIAGWVGATFAQDQRSDNSARIYNWGVALSFLDLFREGDQIGVFMGMPPKLVDIDRGPDDPDTALQFESFYTFPVNDYITINPGFYVITSPEHDRRNDTIFVGLIRTVFAF